MARIRSLARRRTTRGLRRALRTLVEEFKISRRHIAGKRRAPALAVPGARLQLGSGGNQKPGWINVDLFAPEADIALDLREELPFSTGFASEVYSEHLFEHLEYPSDAKRFLTEVHRVLQSGGVFNIVVPDAEIALTAYANHSSSFFKEGRILSYLRQENPDIVLHHVNYFFRADGQHKYAYDEKTLGQALRDAGFVDVRRRDFDPKLDSEKRRRHSLYMRGIRGWVTSRSDESRVD